jgi:hypothetical protein
MKINMDAMKDSKENKTGFVLNRIFRRKYRSLFEKDPATANLILPLAELADSDGRVSIPDPPKKEHYLCSWLKGLKTPEAISYE